MKFFETIRYENGTFWNLEFHNRRLNKTRRDIFGRESSLDLRDYLEYPSNTTNLSIVRYKVIYNENVLGVDIFEYKPKMISSIEIIVDDKIEYGYKSLDRSFIEKYVSDSSADEVLFVKGGLITDTSIANIAIFDGQGWITPKVPLLNGTTRSRYLYEDKITQKDIGVEELVRAKKIAFMNAMVDFKIVKIDKFIGV
jgi:4-amino-4-deoxychorismate lyase